MDKLRKILIISSDLTLREVLYFCFDGWGYEVFIKDKYDYNVDFIKKLSPTVIVIDVHSATEENLKICEIIKNDPLTSFIPIITLIDKRRLKVQLLNLKHGIDDYLIKPPDPLDLRVRIEMAIKRSQYSLYSNPLTGLPGGRIIEENLKERLAKKVCFSFGYIDIDNFKYFNDVYGYLKGDRVIMHTSYLLYSAVKKFGNENDFIGHIGGDDFVFITTPDKYEAVCKNFILMFDKTVPFHYSAEDRKCGFIIARDRTHKIKKIPLMSVSIGVINKNEKSDIKSIIEINEKIAQIKKYLKKIEGSTYMADRRSQNENKTSAWKYNKKYIFLKDYKPLGQILLERNIITARQLEEALNVHWRKGIALGEVLKEYYFLKEKDLEEALTIQKSFVSPSSLSN